LLFSSTHPWAEVTNKESAIHKLFASILYDVGTVAGQAFLDTLPLPLPSSDSTTALVTPKNHNLTPRNFFSHA